MKIYRATSWLLGLGLLVTGGIASAQERPELLPLQNPGFEDGKTNWSIQEKVPMSQIIPEAARTGKMGLRITDEDEKLGSSAFSLPLPATAGKGYRLTYWAKSTSEGAASLSIWFSTAERKDIPEYRPYSLIKKSEEWTKYELLVKAPVSAANMRLWVHSNSGSKTVLDIDDVSLQTASGPEVEAISVPVPEAAAPKDRTRKSPPYIVLKLDDLGTSSNGRISNRWKKLVDFIRERQIKATLGIICNSLEGDKPEYFNWIKEQQATGLFEFWNHGYDHKEWEENGVKLQEFKGTSYEQQKDHLMKSEALAREKLCFPLVSFGAPFNSTDANTAKALAEVKDISIWMYGDKQNPAGKVVLERTDWLGIETPLFVPNVERFIRVYNNYPGNDYFVIQGHPAQWDDARFDQFVKIVDFLTEQKAIFIKPADYVALRRLGPQP